MNNIQKCNNKDISKYDTYRNMTIEKQELDFNFSAFYEKHKVYLPKNISPSSNFLS